MSSRSKLTKRTFISEIDGKEYVRQLTYDECYEMIQNQGRLLSEDYKAFETWPFRSDMKENVAKSYIGVLHFIKFFKLDATSVDEFFLSKFQSQIQHLVVPSEREWYSMERCRRLVWNFEKQDLRKKFKIEEALYAEMFQNFIKNKNVNHGNKSMLLGHEYILWDLTQRFIRGRIEEIKELKIKYKKIPKKISKNFQSSLEFLLYEDENENMEDSGRSKKKSAKRSAGTSIEQTQKRRKLSNDSSEDSSEESSLSNHSIISVRSLHFDHSDSGISEHEIKTLFEL